jgi:hypothetical protein
MFSKHFSIFVLAITTALTGCASFKVTPSPPNTSGDSIKDTRIQLYSFLDVREDVLGITFVAEVNKQLAGALQGELVTTQLATFKDSPAARYFTVSNKDLSVPMVDVIAANLNNEKTFSATHRMILFPKSTLVKDGGPDFVLQVDIYEVKTLKLIWRNTVNVHQYNSIYYDMNSEGRARTLVTEVMKSFKSAKIL